MTPSNLKVHKAVGLPAVVIILQNLPKFVDQRLVQHMAQEHSWMFLSPNPNAFLLMDGKNLICWFGYRVDAMGIVEPFLLPTRRFSRIMKRIGPAVCIMRLAKNFIRSLAKNHRRLEIYTNCAFQTHARTAEHLGFIPEAYLPNYGLDNETFQLWSITNGTP
jgi:hypothetical protein